MQMFEKLQLDHNTTLSEGYSGIGQAFALSVERLESDGVTAGSCAKVVIRIEQELVLTRSAFLATLEISNEGILLYNKDVWQS
jgi:hypothetical protein